MNISKGDTVNLYLRERLDAGFHGTVSEMDEFGITLWHVTIRYNDTVKNLEFSFPWTSVAYVAKMFD